MCGLAGWTAIKEGGGGGGKKHLQINKQPGTDLIVEHELGAGRFSISKTKIDLEAKIQGNTRNDDKRFVYHAIQIGKKDDESYSYSASQVIETTTPPTLDYLMSMQHSFTHNVH